MRKGCVDGLAVAWDRTRGDGFLFRPDEPMQERRRHVRKYARSDVQDKAFFFRGPHERLNLRTQNLKLFAQIAEGVDDERWSSHLERGDYERWFRDAIKDPELADVAAEVARSNDGADQTRRGIWDAIAERYTLPA